MPKFDPPSDDTAEPNSWMTLLWAQLEDGRAPLGKADVTAVASNTEEGKVYYLLDFGWIVACTCRSFRFRSDCSHARDYLERRG